MIAGHPKEAPGYQEDCDVADHGHGVSDGRQSCPLVLAIGEARYQGQVADLNKNCFDILYQ